MKTPQQVIEQTKKWITDVVIGCNFCPFVAKELKNGTVNYKVITSISKEQWMQVFLHECARLDEDKKIITTLLIFADAYKQFDKFLDIAAHAEKLLLKNNYEGVYQVASFHPGYKFEGAPVNDAANYTNRSVYPMLHLLREEQIEKALTRYPNPEQIPDDNINFARKKGVQYMKMLRDACL